MNLQDKLNKLAKDNGIEPKSGVKVAVPWEYNPDGVICVLFYHGRPELYRGKDAELRTLCMWAYMDDPFVEAYVFTEEQWYVADFFVKLGSITFKRRGVTAVPDVVRMAVLVAS